MYYMAFMLHVILSPETGPSCSAYSSNQHFLTYNYFKKSLESLGLAETRLRCYIICLRIRSFTVSS